MLETGLPVSDDVTHVGIRAHFFGPRVAQNRFPVAFAGEMGEPFEWVLEFRYAGQRPDSPPLWVAAHPQGKAAPAPAGGAGHRAGERAAASGVGAVGMINGTKTGCRFESTSGFFGKSRDFNAGMAEKAPQDCIGLG